MPRNSRVWRQNPNAQRSNGINGGAQGPLVFRWPDERLGVIDRRDEEIDVIVSEEPEGRGSRLVMRVAPVEGGYDHVGVEDAGAQARSSERRRSK